VINVIMYHYVRPAGAARYRLDALDVDAFESQIIDLKLRYQSLSIRDLIRTDTINDGVFLTFDDGYADHYDYVLPLLLKHGLQGAFFVPAVSVLERRILDVNKIQFTLAANPDRPALVDRIEQRVGGQYREQYHKANRFDDADTSYIKRLLQTVIPSPTREEIIEELFKKFVTSDEATFADELYMSLSDLHALEDAGMHVGGHGGAHVRLSCLDEANLELEIASTVRLLDKCRQADRVRSFCYPYGDYDSRTTDILKKNEFHLAFTTRSEKFLAGNHDRLEIPRLDTNDVGRARGP
jgi:peptidoglycan/xylan/chitin deacetylase (PgdA/CDA1 family)